MALTNQTDFDALGKVSNKRVKDEARAQAFALLLEALTAVFGDEGVSVVGNATVAVSVGSRTVADGTVPEVSAEIKVTVKEFETHSTASGKAVLAYDRYEAAQDYEDEKTEKEREAEERAKKKAQKVEADKRARAKARAEKEAKKKAGETAPE